MNFKFISTMIFSKVWFHNLFLMDSIIVICLFTGSGKSYQFCIVVLVLQSCTDTLSSNTHIAPMNPLRVLCMSHVQTRNCSKWFSCFVFLTLRTD